MLLCGFNWASTSRSRKRGITRAKFGEVRKLQLGLDLAVEETKRHDAEQHAGCPASIGPRPRGRGNLRALREIRDASDELQFGLDLAVEETLPSLLCPRSR